MSGLFAETVRFELRYYLKRASTWLYFGIFFLVGLLLVLAIGGAFPGVNMAVGGSGGNVRVDSPYVVAVLTGVLSVFSVLVTAALLGNSVYRDYEAGIHPLFFTSPITRFSYLGGRFTGALLAAAVLFTSIPLGILVGSWMPGLDRELFGAARLMGYVQPYLVIVLPNLLFTGAIFFALAAMTRQMLPNHVGGVGLLVGYLIANSLAADTEQRRLAALLDPFGLNAMGLATRYWTSAQRNTLLLPFSGEVLLNRLIWMAVGLAIFAVVFARFRFSHVAPERTGRRARRRAAAAAVAAEARPAHARPVRLEIPAARRSFGAGMQWTQYLSSTRRAFRGIVANRYFFAIVGAGVLFLVLSASEVGKVFGTETWPVTYQVLETLSGYFALFMLIIISFYGGELVWRERDTRIHQVTDATPAPTWVPFAAKLTALVLTVATLQGVILVAGVLTQAARGYYRFELGQYVTTLFGLSFVDYVLLCVLVVLVHTLVNNKYLGHLLVVLYYVFSMFAGQLGLEHNLLRYASDAGLVYSDMNGYGPFLGPYAWFKAYWAAWALLLALLSNLFWVRGQETGAGWRVRLARLRFRRPAATAAAVALALVLGLGGFIFYNTNVLNDFQTGRQVERLRAEYERRYKRLENTPQPRIAAARLAVDIHPERRDVEVRGHYRLENRTTTPVDSLLVRVPVEAEIRALRLGRPARRVLADEERGLHIYHLATPLQPGDSLGLSFDLALDTRGFGNRVERTEVVENGTFFNSGVALPGLGYEPAAELGDDDVRRRHGLGPKERMAPATDTAALRNNQLSRDADWVDFEATVSTSADQIAVAPGYLQREWRQGGRRFFHYRMDAPILNFYSFLSARYAVRRDRWRGPDGREVAIEVLHHPAHDFNVERMIQGTKRALDYYTSQFGPYQHRQVRILEFPRYAQFAQSFPNTIPYSESIGFIARVRGGDDVDYPFYVTAHEVAHQWWAHQVIGAGVQGGAMLVESLSEYSAMMVLEKEYGRPQMRRFLRYNLDRYLQGRAFERKKEMPLARVENQQYIHYAKGSLAFYALRDYMGEERLNGVLSRFLADHRFERPPYTTAPELVGRLRAATPDSLQSVITDLFETITLWDSRARAATATRLPDGRYQVTLDVEARKIRADSLGNETEVRMRDLVDVGVFAAPAAGRKEGRPLYLAKHRVTGGRSRITVVVGERPARAGIDPLNKLIDRVPDDNSMAVTVAAAGAGS